MNKEKKGRFACTDGTNSPFSEMGYEMQSSAPERLCQDAHGSADRKASRVQPGEMALSWDRKKEYLSGPQ